MKVLEMLLVWAEVCFACFANHRKSHFCCALASNFKLARIYVGNACVHTIPRDKCHLCTTHAVRSEMAVPLLPLWLESYFASTIGKTASNDPFLVFPLVSASRSCLSVCPSFSETPAISVSFFKYINSGRCRRTTMILEKENPMRQRTS